MFNGIRGQLEVPETMRTMEGGRWPVACRICVYAPAAPPYGGSAADMRNLHPGEGVGKKEQR